MLPERSADERVDSDCAEVLLPDDAAVAVAAQRRLVDVTPEPDNEVGEVLLVVTAPVAATRVECRGDDEQVLHGTHHIRSLG